MLPSKEARPDPIPPPPDQLPGHHVGHGLWNGEWIPRTKPWDAHVARTGRETDRPYPLTRYPSWMLSLAPHIVPM
jgi:hypothetical protein